jgi:hypothetical protein
MEMQSGCSHGLFVVPLVMVVANVSAVRANKRKGENTIRHGFTICATKTDELTISRVDQLFGLVEPELRELCGEQVVAVPKLTNVFCRVYINVRAWGSACVYSHHVAVDSSIVSNFFDLGFFDGH